MKVQRGIYFLSSSYVHNSERNCGFQNTEDPDVVKTVVMNNLLRPLRLFIPPLTPTRPLAS